MKKTLLIILISLIIALSAATVFFYQNNLSRQKEIFALKTRESQRDNIWQTAKTKSEILNILVSDIILAEKEIPLKVRINMENKIDGSGDKILRAKWDSFAESKDKTFGQSAVEDLLRYLVEEVYRGLR
ncbi:MAG: hypothetical protein AAB525_03300 [Patescibacteria group bacterium]